MSEWRSNWYPVPDLKPLTLMMDSWESTAEQMRAVGARTDALLDSLPAKLEAATLNKITGSTSGLAPKDSRLTYMSGYTASAPNGSVTLSGPILHSAPPAGICYADWVGGLQQSTTGGYVPSQATGVVGVAPTPVYTGDGHIHFDSSGRAFQQAAPAPAAKEDVDRLAGLVDRIMANQRAALEVMAPEPVKIASVEPSCDGCMKVFKALICEGSRRYCDTCCPERFQLGRGHLFAAALLLYALVATLLIRHDYTLLSPLVLGGTALAFFGFMRLTTTPPQPDML